jgi:hypothetical protein
MAADDDTIAHELAILRPRPGDVLVLYLPEAASMAAVQFDVNVFERAIEGKGYVALVIRGRDRHVEHWPRDEARALYEALRKRFERTGGA